MNFILNVNNTNVLLLNSNGYFFKYKIMADFHTSSAFEMVCNPFVLLCRNQYSFYFFTDTETATFGTDKVTISHTDKFKHPDSDIVTFELISKDAIPENILNTNTSGHWDALENSSEIIPIDEYLHPIDLIQRAVDYFDIYPSENYDIYRKVSLIKNRYDYVYLDKFLFNNYNDTEWLQMRFDFESMKTILVDANIISATDIDNYVLIFETLNIASTLVCTVQY